MAVSFFKASPGSLSQMRPSNLTTWSALGHNLYNCTWKSSALACRFIDPTPQLRVALPLPPFLPGGRAWPLAPTAKPARPPMDRPLTNTGPLYWLACRIPPNAWRTLWASDSMAEKAGEPPLRP